VRVEANALQKLTCLPSLLATPNVLKASHRYRSSHALYGVFSGIGRESSTDPGRSGR
jgi:hypothetical protein